MRYLLRYRIHLCKRAAGRTIRDIRVREFKRSPGVAPAPRVELRGSYSGPDLEQTTNFAQPLSTGANQNDTLDPMPDNRAGCGGVSSAKLERCVPADKLQGAQTQRSLEHFSIGQDLIPSEMITAYAIS